MSSLMVPGLRQDTDIWQDLFKTTKLYTGAE